VSEPFTLQFVITAQVPLSDDLIVLHV